MPFDQGQYWAERGEGYRSEFLRHTPETDEAFKRQELELGESLSQYDLSDVRGVMEIGCGFGRLTPILLGALPNAETYIGLDISQGQVDAAREAYSGLPKARFLVGDFRTMQLESVDLVFAGEVFLHFPPESILRVVAKALELGKRLIHLDPFVSVSELPPIDRVRWMVNRRRTHRPTHRTDWQHDYPRLYPHMRVCLQPILGGRQHLFVVGR